MHIPSLIPLLTSTALLAAAAPADNAAAGLRLIKTSESDPGKWVTEEAKISEYTAKGIHFVDITDIKDQDVLVRLSTLPESGRESGVKQKRAVVYPSVLTHQAEAESVIEGVNTEGPQAWLKTMTE